MKSIITLLFLATLVSCGTKTEEKTKEKEPNEEVEVEEIVEKPDTGESCYTYNSTCKGDSKGELNCTLKMTITGENVVANTFCEGCEGVGENFYRGVKHEDTLILDEVQTKPDGNEILTKTFWMMSGDQLNQLVTEKKNGKIILKEQATHTFLASYVKIDCE